MPAFVGEDRRAIVNNLIEAFDACVVDGKPRLVALLAEAGYGKTRVVQEFYKALQTGRQPHGRYWPAEFDAAGRDPMRNRKFVYPEDPSPDPGARMPWLWWGLRCDEDSSGRKVRALFNDRVQLQAHLAGLIDAAERKRSDRELALDTIGEVLGFIPGIGNFVSVAMAAKSLSPRLARRLKTALERGQSRQTPTTEPEVIRTSSVQVLSEAAPELDFIQRFISAELPMVLVVDDAHDADGVTVRFLNHLLQLNVPVLAIATAWPSELHHQEVAERHTPPADLVTFGALLNHAKETLENRVLALELRPLESADVRRLISDVAPATDAERERVLEETSGGIPLVLKLQLATGRVARSIRDGAITLPADELRQLPRTYEELIGARFRELEVREQAWLAEAAWQGRVFFPAIMASDVDPSALTLPRFVTLRREGRASVGRFSEAPVHAAIRAVASEEFSDAERLEWARTALSRIDESGPTLLDSLRDPSDSAAFGELVVRLAEGEASEGVPVNASIVAEAALGRSFAERDLEHHVAERDAAEAAVRWSRQTDDPAAIVSSLTRYASALSANNAVADAVAASEKAVRALEAWPEAGPTRVADTLHVRALALLNDGDVAAARRVTEESEQRAIDAKSDRARLIALEARAFVEEAADDNHAERAAISTAMEIARAQQPVDMEELIGLHTDLLEVELSGSPPAAWQDIAELAERELGAGHWLHLHCLASWANALLLDGDIEGAEAATARYEELSPDGATSELSDYLRAQAAILRGDIGAVQTTLNIWRDALGRPYLSRVESARARGVIDAVATLVGGGAAPSEDSQHWFAAWTRELQTDPVAAFARLHGWLTTEPPDWSEQERLGVVAFSGSALAARLTEDGQLPPEASTLLTRLREFAEDNHCPTLISALLDAVEDATAAIEGRPVPQRPPPPAGVIACRAEMCRAVGWHLAGATENRDAELAKARRSATEVGDRRLLRAVANCHRTCESESEVDVWRQVVELPDVAPEDRINDLVGLGFALYVATRYEEAEAVETRAWEAARTGLGVPDALVHIVGSNLIVTLTDRGHSPDSDRILAIRRELLTRREDEAAHARNLKALSVALEDTQSLAVALAREVNLETDPSRINSLFNHLAATLADLGFNALALEMSILSLWADPTIEHDSELPVSVRNINALAPRVYPDRAKELVARLSQAGIESRLEIEAGGNQEASTPRSVDAE
jgi:hypothetical protein